MSPAPSSTIPTPGLRWTADTGAIRFGWVNVVVAAVVMLATLPGRTQGLGLITEPLLKDLQLDRIAYANINLWATLLGAAICLPIGRVFDRVGLRWTTAALSLALALVVWRMSALTGGITALFVLVLLTRAIGQSALSVASITAVGKSFGSRVGMAMGVYSVLLSVFFAAAFVAIGASVRTGGWRLAWLQVAVGLAFVVTPAVVLFMREPAAPQSGIASGPNIATGLTLGAALRTPAFWVFAGATSLFGLVSSGLGLFNEAVLAERGFNQQTYHTFLAASSIIALVGQFGCGWLTLRWSMQRLLGLAMFIYAAGPRRAASHCLAGAAVDLCGAHRTLGRHDHGDVLRHLAAVRIGTPRANPGGSADADRPRVSHRAASLREVRRPHRVVRADSLDSGAERLPGGPGRAARVRAGRSA